jgi:HlyD family secretion protein
MNGDPAVNEVLARSGGGKKRPWRHLALGGTAAVFLVGALAVVFGGKDPGPRFVTAEATRGDLTVEVTATGTVQATATVEVGAEVTGRLIAVHVDWNDRVEVGQLLAEIDPETYRAAVEEARARVAAAEASILQARATARETAAVLARAEAEAAEGVASGKELDAARAAAERAQAGQASAAAEARVARAALQSALTRLEKTRITSPIRGTVLSRQVDPGQTVTAGFQTPVLFELAEDLSRMSLHVLVDEADVGRVREGQEARFTVDAHPGRTFPSKVLSLRNQPTVDQNVVSYEAVLEVDNRELLLRPGMTATATIVAETKRDVLLVPDAALRFRPPAASGPGFRGPPGFGGPPPRRPGAETRVAGETAARVWILRDGAPAPVPVRPGATDGRHTEVEGDLAPGTPVIVDLAEAP